MNISVINAEYIEGYKIKIIFNDKTSQIIDFENAIFSLKAPQYYKYQKINIFKKFKIEGGNIVWGKDWDIIFPVWDLYINKLKF